MATIIWEVHRETGRDRRGNTIGDHTMARDSSSTMIISSITNKRGPTQMAPGKITSCNHPKVTNIIQIVHTSMAAEVSTEDTVLRQYAAAELPRLSRLTRSARSAKSRASRDLHARPVLLVFRKGRVFALIKLTRQRQWTFFVQQFSRCAIMGIPQFRVRVQEPIKQQQLIR